MSLVKLTKLARLEARAADHEAGPEKDADRCSAEERVLALLEMRGTWPVAVETESVNEGMSSVDGRRECSLLGAFR